MIKGVPYDAEIEYLESTGTQYVETGIVPDASTIWRLTCAATNTSTQFLGAINISGNRFHFSLYDSGNIRGCMGQTQTNVGSPDLAFHVLELNAVNRTVGMDGISVPCVYSGTIPAISIWLFGRNSNNPPYKRMSSVKISASQIWQNGALVRDFIPVRVGTAGYLYDRVSKKLFGNLGTGDFVLGQDKSIPLIGLHFYQKPTPTAKDYAQDGLVAMWDGIENAGWGVHDVNATTWANLLDPDHPLTGNNIAFTGKGTRIPTGCTYTDLDIQSMWNNGFSLEFVVSFLGVTGTSANAIFDVMRLYGSTTSYLAIEIGGAWTSSLSTVGFNTARVRIASGAPISLDRTNPQPRVATVCVTSSTQSKQFLDGLGYASYGAATSNIYVPANNNLTFGGGAGWASNNCMLNAVRFYSRVLTSAEITHNYAIDKERFKLT